MTTTSPAQWFERVYPLIRKVSPTAPEEQIEEERRFLFDQMFPDAHQANMEQLNQLIADRIKLQKEYEEMIDDLVERRNKDRAQGHWKAADDIRDFLAKHGITIKDGKGSSTWQKK